VSTASIDPRIRARRIAVRRDEGRRRLRRLVGVIIAAAVVGLAGLATRTPLLDVDRVVVRGATHTPSEEILRATGVARGDPLTDIDLARARRAVAALPWVARATITRQWPGTVQIDVVEREAVAAVPAGTDQWMLVDQTGRGLELVGQLPAGMVALAGLPPIAAVGASADPAAADALVVAEQLPADLAAQVASIGLAEGGGLELTLAAGGVVRFGPPTDVAAKLLALRTVLETVDLESLATLDLRVPSVPVLTRVD